MAPPASAQPNDTTTTGLVLPLVLWAATGAVIGADGAFLNLAAGGNGTSPEQLLPETGSGTVAP